MNIQQNSAGFFFLIVTVDEELPYTPVIMNIEFSNITLKNILCLPSARKPDSHFIFKTRVL